MRPKSQSGSPIAERPLTSNHGLPSAVKEKCRRVVAGALYHSGLLSAAKRLEGSHELSQVEGLNLPRLRRSASSKFAILCYHRVGTEGVPVFSRLEPRVFEAQIRYLKNRYRIVSLGQLCQELQSGAAVAPTLAVTFDDGYRDLYSYAFPVLQKYEIPATIYLIGNCMETGETPWYDRIFVALQSSPSRVLEVDLTKPTRFALSNPEARSAAAWKIVCYLRSIPDIARRRWCADFEQRVTLPLAQLEGHMLNWEQVHAMQKDGVFFGAHSMSHPSVSRLDSVALKDELTRSKTRLEAGLQTPVSDFAYPFGKPSDCSVAAEDVLSLAGYRSAVTTTAGRNTVGMNLYRLRRMQISDDRSMSSFGFNIARMFLDGDTASHEEIEGSPAGDSPAALQEKNTVRL